MKIRHRIFCYYAEPGLYWFRLFGVGLCAKDATRHGLNFSERYGYDRYLRLGRWVITWLGRDGQCQ